MDQKIKVLIVDDEELARKRIEKSLQQNQNFNFEINQACDGVEALEKIKEWQPNIVFLDIEMPEYTGFDVLNEIEKIDFQVIFQTAYNEYAIKAFEVNACDYLLKPFNDERLFQSIERAFKNISTNKDQVDHSAEALQKSMHIENLTIKVGNKVKIININSISHFISESHQTLAYLLDKQYVIDHSINFLEERLDKKIFITVHRGCIINREHVKEYAIGPTMFLTMKNGASIQVARERKTTVKDFLKNNI